MEADNKKIKSERAKIYSFRITDNDLTVTVQIIDLNRNVTEYRRYDKTKYKMAMQLLEYDIKLLNERTNPKQRLDIKQ